MPDFNSILERMLSKVPNTFDKRQGSIIYDALAPAAAELAQMYINSDIFKEQTYLLTASGDNLSRRANDFAITRYPATKAIRVGRTYSLTGEPVNVSIGDRFVTPNMRGGLVYSVIELRELGECLLKAELPGTQGNEYYGDILPLTILNNLGRAEIIGTETPARNAETDDEFRNRIIERLQHKAFAGNIAAYKEFTKEIDGVGDLKVFPAWNGGGTVKLSIIDGIYEPISQTFINTIKNTIDPPEITGMGFGAAPIGHKVTIVTPVKLTINISATLTLDNRTLGQIEEAVIENLKDYILSVRQNWANDVSSNIFIARISEAILRVSHIINVRNITINGKTYDLEILSTPQLQQLPFLGTVTLTEG